jgi:hypothetical protein
VDRATLLFVRWLPSARKSLPGCTRAFNDVQLQPKVCWGTKWGTRRKPWRDSLRVQRVNWALGDRISRYSGDDIRVNGLTAAGTLACGVRELVHQVTAVRGSFPTIKLRFPFGNGLAERGNPLLLGLQSDLHDILPVSVASVILSSMNSILMSRGAFDGRTLRS